MFPDLPEAPEAVEVAAALAVEVSAAEEVIPPVVGDIVFRRIRIGIFLLFSTKFPIFSPDFPEGKLACLFVLY